MMKHDGRIRVLYLASGLAVEGPIGGAARFVTELARALDPERFAASIIALWDYGTQAEQERAKSLRAAGIATRMVGRWDANAPLGSCARSLHALWSDAGTLHADILHSHGEFSDVSTVLLKQRLGIPYAVRTFHNVVEWPKRPRLGTLLANTVYPFTYEAEVGVSQRATDGLRARPLATLLGREAHRIYNAIDLTRFDAVRATGASLRAQLRAEFGIPNDASVLGSYGRLVRLKGYHDLLDAAAVVLRTTPQAWLIIAGDGPERAALEQQAHALGIGERVVFAGFRRDVEQLLMAFDLFVSPSLIEGLPTSVMEAMASGVPIVATAIPGNKELVTHGVTGVLTPPADPGALAHALLMSVQGATCAEAMAAAAQRRVREHFSIEPAARAYEAIYASLAQQGSRP